MLATAAATSAVDMDLLMERLKGAVFKDRPRMHDFFCDYDQLRSGKVSEAKFRTALQASAVLPLTEKELQMLTEKYSEGPRTQRVLYTKLLEDLEVFTCPGMERLPTAQVEDFTKSLVRPPTWLPADAESESDAVIAKIAHLVKTRGLAVRPPFFDYAKNVNSPMLVEQVTLEQFANGLSQLDLKLSASEVEVLQQKFAGVAPGHVNFVAFACAVDPGEAVFSSREPRSTVENKLHGGFRTTHVIDGGMAQPGRPPTCADAPTLPLTIPASDVEKLIAKLQDKALEHRVRLIEHLQDFDKHNDGTITLPQFIKALSVAYRSMKMGLSEDEILLLSSHYKRKMCHGAEHVEWRRFAADVDAVFTKDHLQKAPVKIPPTRYLQQSAVPLDPESESQVHQVLEELRKRVEVRRVLMRPLFEDFEKNVGSPKVIDHMTRQQVLQSFAKCGIELTPPQQSLLFRRYDTLGDGTVNFIALVRDIDPYETFSGRITKHHALPQDPQWGKVSRGVPHGGFLRPKTSSGPLCLQPGRPPTVNDMPGSPPPSSELSKLLTRLSGAASRHRVRIEEAFRDFDRHRDGTITVPQFSIGLQSAFGKYECISELDFQLLAQAFGVAKPGAHHVQWREFCRSVNGGAIDHTRLAKPCSVAPSAPLSPAEEEEMRACLARFAYLCKTRRLFVQPFFDDLNKNRRSMNDVDHVSRAQFGQCLSSLGLECSGRELDVIQRYYDDQGDGYVNYVAFTKEICPLEQYLTRDETGQIGKVSVFQKSGGFMAPKVSVAQPGRAPLVAEYPRLVQDKPVAGTVDELLTRLKSKISKFHIGIENFFRDHDRHIHGVVTKAQFRAGISRAFSQSYCRADLTAEEMLALEAAYTIKRADGGDAIEWRRFCRDVDQVLTLPNLEYNPTSPVEEVHAAMLAPPPPVSMSAADEARLAGVLDTIKTRFKIRHVEAKPPYADFHFSQNSEMMIDHVTRQQFSQSLHKLGIQLKEEELALIFRKFDDLGDGSVNYVSFTQAVDDIERQAGRGQGLPTGPGGQPLLANGFRKPNSAYA